MFGFSANKTFQSLIRYTIIAITKNPFLFQHFI